MNMKAFSIFFLFLLTGYWVRAQEVPDSIRLQQRYQLANVYIASYQFDKALSELSECYIKDPKNVDYLLKIAYCHSGVRSAHTSFVLTQLLGYNQVHNYDGSWLEWSSFEGAPVEKDSLTTILE